MAENELFVPPSVSEKEKLVGAGKRCCGGVSPQCLLCHSTAETILAGK